MEDINVRLGYTSVDECAQSPEIQSIEIIIETSPPIIFSLDEPEECTTYKFERTEGEPEDLVSKTIAIDSYRVTESSQSPVVENICGNIVLRFLNEEVKVLSFDLEEQ